MSVTGAKRAKSNPQFNAGFEGLNLYQQRFARRGNQFTVEPPEAWLGRELDETAVTPGAADVGPGPGTVAAAGAASGAALVAVVRAVFEVVAVVGVPETPVPLSPCAGAFGAPHAASAIAPASGSHHVYRTTKVGFLTSSKRNPPECWAGFGAI